MAFCILEVLKLRLEQLRRIQSLLLPRVAYCCVVATQSLIVPPLIEMNFLSMATPQQPIHQQRWRC